MSIWDVFERISAQKNTAGKPEYIVCGLGNPGIKYEQTRHNAGFMAIAALEEELGFRTETYKFKAKTAAVTIAEKNCLVMRPETFMNNSGEAVSQAMNFYKIPIENVIVIFDDISLEPGHMRIRRKGSAGGHNGIKSIIELCGSEDFPRIKLGVGAKPSPEYDLADWVLGRFSDGDRALLNDALKNVRAAVELILGGGIAQAMNLYNR